MDIFDQLYEDSTWVQFLQYKVLSGNLSKAEESDLVKFITEKEYHPILDKIKRDQFPIPTKLLISKMGSDKKRVVYCFPREENYVLKLITFLLLRKYAHLFAPNLYSFRVNHGVSTAVKELKNHGNLSGKFVYKVDIHDYFNSVDINILFPLLDKELQDDPVILNLIKSILSNPKVILREGNIIEETKGIMAGIPLSAFLANLYLCEMDWHFDSRNTLYLRYSDDIIIFQDSESQLKEDVEWLQNHLRERQLTINTKKELWATPGEEWTFLGIKYQDGVFDISDASVKKICDKMRRKYRALIRWRHRKGVVPEKVARKFVAIFNRKLYENHLRSDLTWTRWFFPVITTTKSLKRIDNYMQECVRYIMTETRTNRRYNCTYDEIRNLGYRCLVNEYYKSKKALFPK